MLQAPSFSITLIPARNSRHIIDFSDGTVAWLVQYSMVWYGMVWCLAGCEHEGWCGPTNRACGGSAGHIGVTRPAVYPMRPMCIGWLRPVSVISLTSWPKGNYL